MNDYVALESEAKELRTKIDEFNTKIYEAIEKRNELNAQFSSLIQEGRENKSKRDEINAHIVSFKESKSGELSEIKELNKNIPDAKKKRDELFAKHEKKKEPFIKNPSEIKAEIKKLEQKIEHSVISIKEENKIIDRIRVLKREFKKVEDLYEANNTLNTLVSERNKLRKQLSSYNKEMRTKSAESQKHHERMTECFRRADDVKKDADHYHAEFVKLKEEIDEFYKRWREINEKRKELGIVFREEKIKRQVERIKKRDEEFEKKADSLFEEFKKGKKLTLEDLKILQETSK